MPSVFDGGKYTLYSGDRHPYFFGLPTWGGKSQMRIVEIFYEPAAFFAAGLLLWAIGQPVGTLLLIASLSYALSYRAAYWLGDNDMMDWMDEVIRKRQLRNVLVRGLAPQQTEGVEIRSRPVNATDAEALVEHIMANDYRVAATVS